MLLAVWNKCPMYYSVDHQLHHHLQEWTPRHHQFLSWCSSSWWWCGLCHFKAWYHLSSHDVREKSDGVNSRREGGTDGRWWGGEKGKDFQPTESSSYYIIHHRDLFSLSTPPEIYTFFRPPHLTHQSQSPHPTPPLFQETCLVSFKPPSTIF